MADASDPSGTGACTGAEASQFDFWLGAWDLTWPAEQTGGPEGTFATGTNVIDKILDGCVVRENFSVSDGSYRGSSLSIFHEGRWRQTWVDTGGAHLLLRGEFHDGVMELRTEPKERGGTVSVHRMLFRDIAETSLEWVWQRSVDDGASWVDLWTIRYRRSA